MQDRLPSQDARSLRGIAPGRAASNRPEKRQASRDTERERLYYAVADGSLVRSREWPVRGRSLESSRRLRGGTLGKGE